MYRGNLRILRTYFFLCLYCAQSAADSVLKTLKNEGMKDFDKKEIEEVIAPSSSTFRRNYGLQR
jgi:hypothetical protein